MNELLKQQLKEHLAIDNVEAVPAMHDFLEAVSKTYSDLQSPNIPFSGASSSPSTAQDANELNLNEIADHMETGAILIDLQGQVTFLNKVAISHLGTSDPKEAIDSLAEVFPTVAIKDLIAKALQGESSEVPEVELSNVVLSISIVSLKEEGGSFGCLIWLKDITAQKLLERSKNQFITIASHEMRTPLAVIRGNAELLLDEDAVKTNPTTKQEAESVLNSAIRLLDIVNDFLDVQNLESGKIMLNPTPVDIPAVLDATYQELKKMADDKGINYHYIEMSKPPLVTIDKSRLQQICINIVSNAIHYTDHGNIIVTLETTPEHVKILFQDTGTGITEEDQQRLFQKFATGKTFLKSREYGSGLGLYISSMLAHLMQCEIKLESSVVGSGSTFSLTIPILKPQETEAPGAQNASIKA